MFFRTPRFIRRWIRKKMHPMAEKNAWGVRQKLSFLYIFFAWNAFGYVCYQIVNGKKHWPQHYGLVSEEEAMMRPAQWYAERLGIKKAQVYRVGGTSISSISEAGVIDVEKKSTNRIIADADAENISSEK